MLSKKKKKRKMEKKHRSRLVLGLAYSLPDCWLEVCLHPEGPATSQLDQGFLWFSLVPEQMLSWHPNSTLHCMLHMEPFNAEWTRHKDILLDHPIPEGYIYGDLSLQVGG
jgi:hypothetical protein